MKSDIFFVMLKSDCNITKLEPKLILGTGFYDQLRPKCEHSTQ